MNAWPIISEDAEIQREYEEARESGTGHNLAKMCVLRKPPAVMTDDVFLAGRRNNAQFVNHPKLGHYYKGVAESKGISTVGKTYISGLARYPGDPEAWVSGRGDAKNVLEKRGWGCKGAINLKAREPLNPIEEPRVDPKLIEREVNYRKTTGDMMGCADTNELKEKLTNLRGWKKEADIEEV